MTSIVSVKLKEKLAYEDRSIIITSRFGRVDREFERVSSPASDILLQLFKLKTFKTK